MEFKNPTVVWCDLSTAQMTFNFANTVWLHENAIKQTHCKIFWGNKRSILWFKICQNQKYN